MKRKDIIAKLQEMGINAEEASSLKNGVVFEGIVIRTEGSNIAPIIYTDPIIEAAMAAGKTVEEAAKKVVEIYEESKGPCFDLDEMLSRGGILETIKIGLQKTSTENIVKRETPFPGIEQYLFIGDDMEGGGSYAIRVKPELLESREIEISEAWEAAERNTFAETRIHGMTSVLMELMPGDIPEELKDAFTAQEEVMYVVTNEKRYRGASAILNTAAIKDFAEIHGFKKLAVIPSSIHEVIIVPVDDEAGKADLDEMIAEVNATEVTPEEVLGSEAFFMEV